MEKFNRGAGYGYAINWAIVALSIVFAMSFATQFYVANASDPSPLQDFCVEARDFNSGVFVNGKYCKNEDEVTTNDFVYKGFDKPGDTNNILAAKATLIDINKFAAVNTLGVSIARVDFGPYGLNTPHFHPLGSEIFTVLEGTLYAGFVTTKNKLYDMVLKKGDIIVFPQGLLHFQLNLDETDAFAIATFGSQNPGRINIADAVFGTPILDDVLTKAFQVNQKATEQLRAQFLTNNASDDNPRKSVLRLLSQLSK